MALDPDVGQITLHDQDLALDLDDDGVILLLVDDQGSSRMVVVASRRWLCQHSLFFNRLLSGCFRESSQSIVPIETNLERFVLYMQYLEGRTEINCSNLLPLYQASLYFGGGRNEETPLVKGCQNWLLNCIETDDIFEELIFADLVHLWLYGIENNLDWMSTTCEGYISKNFMWASSDTYFFAIPLELLLRCIRDPDLAVDSERHLSEVLLSWISANNIHTTELLEEVRACNLPVQFIMANLKNFDDVEDFSKAVKRLQLFELSDDAYEIDHTTMIRLSKYSKRIDLEGCVMTTSEMFFQSLRPYSVDGSSETLIANYPEFKMWPSDFSIWPDGVSLDSFTSMGELDISKCHNLNLYPIINCCQRAFPNLTKLRMRHFWKLDPIDICQILLKCSTLEELDLSIDINPMRVASEHSHLVTCGVAMRYSHMHHDRHSMLKNLTLEGRSDLTDHCFSHLGDLVGLLRHLNVRGCSSLTDEGISRILRECRRLESIIADDTALGELAVSLLCERDLTTLSIGGCRDITEASIGKLLSYVPTIQTLDLRETCLNDDSLKLFLGCNLVALNVSSTKISGHAILSLLKRNSKLEKLSIGWGFPVYCLDNASASFEQLKSICLGLGATLPSDGMEKLSLMCPRLESIEFKFQSISHETVKAAMKSLKRLAAFSLSYCFIEDDKQLDLEKLARLFRSLVKLKLERVTPLLTNRTLRKLSKKCPLLIEIHLVGCKLLNTGTMQILSRGWPGIVALHLEDCGGVTSQGVGTLLDCKSMEKLHLRHNGTGIPVNFIVEACSQMPLLRVLSLDRCDFVDSQIDLDIPRLEGGALRILVMVKCESGEHDRLFKSKTAFVTEVWERSSQGITRTVCKGLLQ